MVTGANVLNAEEIEKYTRIGLGAIDERKHIISADWLKKVSMRSKFSECRHFVLFGDECLAESEILSVFARGPDNGCGNTEIP